MQGLQAWNGQLDCVFVCVWWGAVGLVFLVYHSHFFFFLTLVFIAKNLLQTSLLYFQVRARLPQLTPSKKSSTELLVVSDALKHLLTGCNQLLRKLEPQHSLSVANFSEFAPKVIYIGSEDTNITCLATTTVITVTGKNINIMGTSEYIGEYFVLFIQYFINPKLFQ